LETGSKTKINCKTKIQLFFLREFNSPNVFLGRADDEMVWANMPYRHLFSEKYRNHTGMSQGQHGSQHIPDYLKTSAIALLQRVWFSTYYASETACQLGSAQSHWGSSQLSPDLAAFGEGTPGTGNEYKGKGGKEEFGGMKAAKRVKVPYQHFFPTSSPVLGTLW